MVELASRFEAAFDSGKLLAADLGLGLRIAIME